MTRLFVAAWPSGRAAVALRSLPRPDEPGVRWVPQQNWHVTLRFIGEAAVDRVGEMLDTTRLPRATAELGPAVERLDGRQIVVPAHGVDELARTVRAVTAHIGEPDRHAFRGHLTIGRTRPHVSSAVLGTEVSTSFDVAEIALVGSDLLPSGAVYTTFATFATVATG